MIFGRYTQRFWPDVWMVPDIAPALRRSTCRILAGIGGLYRSRFGDLCKAAFPQPRLDEWTGFTASG